MKKFLDETKSHSSHLLTSEGLKSCLIKEEEKNKTNEERVRERER